MADKTLRKYFEKRVPGLYEAREKIGKDTLENFAARDDPEREQCKKEDIPNTIESYATDVLGAKELNSDDSGVSFRAEDGRNLWISYTFVTRDHPLTTEDSLRFFVTLNVMRGSE